MSRWVLPCILLVASPVLIRPVDESKKSAPISAHNCYAENREDNPRFVEALDLEIDNIEIDLGWDQANGCLIVGHDATPRAGIAYPKLETTVTPALERHWKAKGTSGGPTVLTIDWKTDRPEAVRQFKKYLDAHADWFSSAPKAAESLLTSRRLTVCFSGSEAAKDAYDVLIPEGGTYRAFRDRVIGAGQSYEPDIASYIPAKSNAYHRFLAFHWSAVERGGPAGAGEWTEAEAKRLSTLMDLAHDRGFRVRFYCLNGHTGARLGGYRFADDEAARIRWKAASKAKVDWIATDEYREIAEFFAKMDGQ